MDGFGLEARDVMFAELVALKFSPAEVFEIIFQPMGAPDTASAAYLLARPRLKELIKNLREKVPKPKPAQEEKVRIKDARHLSRADVTEELWKQYKNGKAGKERADILLKFADFKQMEKDPEEKRVTYYLPLKCNVCPLKANDKK
jgi:hypothetical protein